MYLWRKNDKTPQTNTMNTHTENENQKVHIACPLCVQFITDKSQSEASDIVANHNDSIHNGNNIACIVPDLSLTSIQDFLVHTHTVADDSTLQKLHNMLQDQSDKFPFTLTHEEYLSVTEFTTQQQYGLYTVYFDGSCYEEYGEGTIGGCVISPADRTVITISRQLPCKVDDSMVTECRALHETLKKCREQDIEHIHIKGDQDMIIGHLNDQNKIRKPQLQLILNDIENTLDQFAKWSTTCISGEENKAHILADKAHKTIEENTT